MKMNEVNFFDVLERIEEDELIAEKLPGIAKKYLNKEIEVSLVPEKKDIDVFVNIVKELEDKGLIVVFDHDEWDISVHEGVEYVKRMKPKNNNTFEIGFGAKIERYGIVMYVDSSGYITEEQTGVSMGRDMSFIKRKIDGIKTVIANTLKEVGKLPNVELVKKINA